MAQESKKQKFLLAILSSIAALSGFLFGYDTGVISGAILFIKQDFALTTLNTELIVGIVSFGAIFGALLGGRLSDRFGRKKIVLGSSLLFIISAIGLALSPTISIMIAWRFVVGFAIGVASAMAPLYIAELAPRPIRGALVTINQLAITIGILASYLTGLAFVSERNWHLMFALAAVPAGIQFLFMLFFPESPRYLIKQGDHEKALAILTKYRGSKEDAEFEVAHIEKLAKKEKSRWRDLLQKSIRPALIAGIGITIIQQITGINTIIYYAPTIFQFAGFQSDRAAILATTGVGIVNMLFTFVAIYLLDRSGRKPLLYMGLSGMVLGLFALGSAFLFNTTSATIGWVSIIAMMVYIASFAYGMGPMGWLLNSELYPLNIRGRAVGLATCANWFSNFIVTITFLNLIDLLGKTGVFWLYGAIGLFGLYFVYKKVPETKNKSLEEIEEFWKSP